MMFCCEILVLVVICTVLEFVHFSNGFRSEISGKEFDENFHWQHPETGEVVQLKSKGKFKNVIDLNAVPGVKRVICNSNKLIVALDNSQVAASWSVNDIIMGDESFECQLGLSHAPDKGIFRKITYINIPDNRKAEVLSTEASFYDLLEHAHIFYHHSPAKLSKNQATSNSRVRRDWFASDWFDAAKNWAKEKVLSQILPIKWGSGGGGGAGISTGFNYDDSKKTAAGKFGVEFDETENVGFDAKENTWFEHEKSVETRTSSFNRHASVTTRVECIACYLNFRSAITFELQIDRDSKNNIRFKKYLLQFDASIKLNYDVKLSVNGEFSVDYKTLVWKSARAVQFNIPIPVVSAFGITLKVALRPEIHLEAGFEADAELSTVFGFESFGKYTITSQKIGSQPSTLKHSNEFEPFKPHNPTVNFAAEAFGHFSVYPKIEISTGLAFGFTSKTFEIALLAPLAIGVKPQLVLNFELKNSMGSALVGTLDIVLSLFIDYDLRPVNLDISLLGKLWKFQILQFSNAGSVQVGSNPASLVNEERLTCVSKTSTKCDAATIPITNVDDKRLKNLNTRRMIFADASAKYMAGNMAAKLVRFADILTAHKGWSDRKLIVKLAWDKNDRGQRNAPRHSSALVSEGRQVELAISLRSEHQVEDTSLLQELEHYAVCCGFCNVERFDRSVIVHVNAEAKDSDERRNYITRLHRPHRRKLRVYELPVGQGEATIIQCPEPGDLTIVDMGQIYKQKKKPIFFQKTDIKHFLSGKMNKIKHIFITHKHTDHYNIIKDLLIPERKGHAIIKNPAGVKLYVAKGTFNIKENFGNSLMEEMDITEIGKCDDKCDKKVNICPGTTFIKSIIIEVIASKLGSPINDNGLVLRLSVGLQKPNKQPFSMLFLGDLTGNFQSKTAIPSKIHKLSHHGSEFNNNYNTRTYLNKINPEVVICSGNPWHSYGHPRCSSLNASLATASVAILPNNLPKLRYTPQEQFYCGSKTVQKKLELFDIPNINKAAVFTHATTQDKPTVIQIDYNVATGITQIHTLFGNPGGFSSRRKRSVEEDETYKFAGAASDMPRIEWCTEEKFPSLNDGDSYPKDKNMEEVCLPMMYPITRDDERFLSLYYYPYDDVKFENEERLDSWCGTQDRACTDCREDVDPDTNIWDRCADRVMTFRLGFRLSRLAFLASQYVWDGAESKDIGVLEAWDEPTSSNEHKYGDESLHYEARAAMIYLINSTASDMARFGGLARCAGFDYVRRKGNRLEVCVHSQEDDLGEMVPFIEEGKLLAVTPPSHLVDEYAYPGVFMNETRKVKLFDGFKKAQKISSHFTIGDFVCPNKRLFRLDEKLVECLENTIQHYGKNFEIIRGSAYRTRSQNLKGLHSRHEEEKYRFQSGQAVELKIKPSSRKSLVDLSKEIIKSCASILIYEQLSIGIGLHSYRLYVDIRPTKDNGKQLFVTWTTSKAKRNSKSNENDNLKNLVSQVNEGGPLIIPSSEARACRSTALGEDLYFISVPSHGSCFDEDNYFCEETRKHRESVVSTLERTIRSKLGHRMIPTSDLKTCFVSTCGCEKVSVPLATAEISLCEQKATTGDCEFYQCLNSKHNCGSSGYAMSYGYKYCTKFSQCYSQFNNAGKTWIDRMRKCKMEELLDFYHREAADCEELRDHAIRSSSGCYLQNGFCSISKDNQNLLAFFTCVFEVQDSTNADAIKHFLETITMCGDGVLDHFLKNSTDISEYTRQEIVDTLEQINGRGLPNFQFDLDFLDFFLQPDTVDLKVLACAKFLQEYISTAGSQFQDVSFFNTDTIESSVHSLACENLCLENTQLYSIVFPAVMTKYKPYPSESIEERLYNERDNPNPTLDILEQMVAMHAKGHVNVYIESDMDFSALTKPLKILMAYNKAVTKITFHVAPAASKDIFMDAIARKVEVWAGNACPRRSRIAITPFEVVDIPHHVVKRSLEQSQRRNRNKRRIHNWELHWLARN